MRHEFSPRLEEKYCIVKQSGGLGWRTASSWPYVILIFRNTERSEGTLGPDAATSEIQFWLENCKCIINVNNNNNHVFFHLYIKSYVKNCFICTNSNPQGTYWKVVEGTHYSDLGSCTSFFDKRNQVSWND